ncbi:SIP domain-containing protein [Cribrihabitans pelagius]|uniref:SIP domain-containing protein n=1 Tax=Cribrihabitans pelagius TaxID=1765746 RepID=UPI003B5A25FE
MKLGQFFLNAGAGLLGCCCPGKLNRLSMVLLPAASFLALTPAAGIADLFPTVIEHRYGTTTVPAKPKRIVSLSFIGHDFLLALGETSYPVTAPEGIALTWLRRRDGHGLADRALAARKEFPGHFLWFACEKADVQRPREAVRQDKPAPGQNYIAAYWRQS